MHSPVRTCLGCGLKTGKAELVRLVIVDGSLVADELAILPGRGAYCCRKAACYQRLVKQRKKLAWALRCQEGVMGIFLRSLAEMPDIIRCS